jgi:hypothetical protein
VCTIKRRKRRRRKKEEGGCGGGEREPHVDGTSILKPN